MFNHSLFTATALVLSLVVSTASYAETSSGQIIKGKSCTSVPVDQQCRLYLTGIAKGILTTKAVLAEQAELNNSDQKNSAYAERAYQTRVWTLRDSQANKQNYKSQVCLPERENNETLSRQVVDEIINAKVVESNLYRQVYKTILALYPC